MAEKSTWIKIDRKILKWEWYTDNNTKALFLHLLLKANIKDSRFRGIDVKRGQLITSYAHLSAETGMSSKSVRTALNHLKRTGEVASQSYHDFSLITIQKFDLYQDRWASQTASNGQAVGKPRASQGQQSKNIKKERIEKEYTRTRVEPEIEDTAWEDELGVPEDFKGRFADADDWLEFRSKAL